MSEPVSEIKIPPIRNGTVIDHIKAGQALNVLKILGVSEDTIDSTISIAMRVATEKHGMKWKDIVKLEDMELDPDAADKIALIAPDATISIIRDYYVAEKSQVKLPDTVVGLVKCSNPNCITNKGEPVSPQFYVESRNPPRLRCMYCDRVLINISDNLI
ncbi:aspartate carbamoyltransferase, regulatory subunit [Thermoplasmatales archaeon BRNA1]|nr:aspartate carbamoyltransferase, regulatory subunit [Thermoplasmatales archaeon BRNA1]